MIEPFKLSFKPGDRVVGVGPPDEPTIRTVDGLIVSMVSGECSKCHIQLVVLWTFDSHASSSFECACSLLIEATVLEAHEERCKKK